MSIKINNEYTHSIADTITRAILICDRALPFMRSCDGKRMLVIKILNDNVSYCDDLVGYYYGNELDKETHEYYLESFKQTLAHDLSGLFDKDKHFVPRINNQTV